MTVPVVRQRQKRPKTRTGCRTCRARHVKCDESSFPCQRCIRAGRICEGYDAPTKVAPSRGSNVALLPRNSPPITPGPSAGVRNPLAAKMGTADSYAFDFFRHEAVWQLPGSSLDWDKLVLQASYGEPAITHAAMAIGSLCRSRAAPAEHGPCLESHIELALSHYSKSMTHISNYIRDLKEPGSPGNVEVILLVSLLFFCFEILSGEDLRAHVHFRTGLRILYEQIKHDAQSPSAEKEKRTVILQPRPRNNMGLLLNTFIRLDQDATLMDGYEPFLYPIINDAMPPYFGSVEEARVHLGVLASNVLEIFNEVDELGREELAKTRDLTGMIEEEVFVLASVTSRFLPETMHVEASARMMEARAQLKLWLNAFALLPHQEAPSLAAARLMLQIEYFDVWLSTCTWKDEDEMMVDRLQDQYAHLLLLTEQYINLHIDVRNPKALNSPMTRPSFALGTRLVESLAHISWKCRDPTTRRRAIDLIRRINMAGVSDSIYLAAVCEKAIEIEEGEAAGEVMSAADIPESARILELEMCSPTAGTDDFWKLDVGRVVYVKAGDGESKELQLHDVVFNIPRVKTPGE